VGKVDGQWFFFGVDSSEAEYADKSDGNTLIASALGSLERAMQSQSKPKRPVGVIVIAAIAFAGGLLSLFGAASVFSGNATGPTWLAIVVTIFGLLGLTLGVGFYTGARWAWMGGIVIYIVSIALGILEILYGGTVGGVGGVIRIVAGVVIPLYLTRAGPKTFFGKAPASHSP
jgi:hypothetical protein